MTDSADALDQDDVVRRSAPASAAVGVLAVGSGAAVAHLLAPINDAFGKLPKAALDKALGDPKGLLTTVLTYHVVAGRLTPAELPGMHKTLQGGTIAVTGSGTDFTVNVAAHVVCGNVPTANATVYVIDNVLLPK